MTAVISWKLLGQRQASVRRWSLELSWDTILSLIYLPPLVHFRWERFCGHRSPGTLLSSAQQGCPLSVQLWYPAEPGSGDGPAPYRPEGAALLSAERWVRTGAILNAALSSRRTRYPVLVSVPGWAGLRSENTTFVQDLASRGFIVAGIGYDDPACAGVDRSAAMPATDIDFSSQAGVRTHARRRPSEDRESRKGGLAYH